MADELNRPHGKANRESQGYEPSYPDGPPFIVQSEGLDELADEQKRSRANYGHDDEEHIDGNPFFHGHKDTPVRMSLLTGGSERPIERKVATEAPDRLEALLTGLTNAQVETATALQRVANSVENSLEERAEKKALVLAAPEIAARQVAEAATLAAEERARVANESAAAARKETVIALERQRQAEATSLARVEPVFVAPTPLEIELSVLKNGEDLIRQFVLKSGGRSIALDVLRGQDGRVRNLVTRKE